MHRALLTLSFLAGLAACGGADAEGLDPQIPSPGSGTGVVTPSPAGALPAPTSTLRRGEVRAVVRSGLGAFLQKVEVEEQPVFRNGKFVGFRIAALKGDGWKGVDLKPGDVVTSVNGYPIEHPEDAMAAFKSLDVSSELRVDYERGGEPRTLRYGIIDE
jgi:S1-C subfamily serine protease